MFIKSYFFIIFQIVLQSTLARQSQPVKDIKIGAIFFKEEKNIVEAFKSAINANNKNQQNVEVQFIPIIRYATTDDSNLLKRLACDLISNGTIAIFGPSSKASSDIVASICSYFEIPHIRFDSRQDESTIEKLSHDMTLNVYPSVTALSKVYQDAILDSPWKVFTIIYEEDSALEIFQDVMQLYPLHRSGIRLKKINKEESYDVLWKNIYDSIAHKVILDCKSENLFALLKSATKFNMTDHYKCILLSNLDNHLVDLSEVKDVIKANLTAIRVDYKNNYAQNKQFREIRSAIIFDAVQLITNAILNVRREIQIIEPTAINCGNNNKPRIPWYNNGIGKRIISYMRRYTYTADTDNNFITKKLQFDEFGERNYIEMEYFFPLTGDSIKADESEEESEEVKPKKIVSFTGRAFLKVVARTGLPYIDYKDNKDENFQGNNRFMGYAADLLNKLSQSETFPFDYSIEIVQGNQYGKKDPITGEWNGIVRQLIDNKADLGICDLTVTQERRQVVDFTVPFMSLGIGIMYYNKPAPEPEMFSFLKPFSLEVWYYMATSYLIVSILLFLLSRVADNEWENPHPCNPNPTELENKWSIINTTWLTMGSIMGQGCDILPKTGSMRLVNGMWWFFALMMLNSYTANLAAFLTYNRIDTEITGLDSLAEQTKIRFGTFEGGSTANFFRDSNDSLYTSAWSKMVSARPKVFTGDNIEGLERVKSQKGKYAYLIETTTLEYMMERNCDVKQVGPKIGEKHYAIAVPKQSPYRSNLSVSILKLSESGELFKLKNRWWKPTNNNTCEKPSATNTNELSIEQVGGVFVLLGGGLLASYILGLSEFLWNIQQVAVEDKISPMMALKQEAVFAMKFWITKKPIHSASRSVSQSRRSSQSQSQCQNVNLIKT